MKICVVGAELFHADKRRNGQMKKRTGVTMLRVAFRSFAEASVNACALRKRLYIDDVRTEG